jgi:SAM-dependent methyltransferase
MDAHHPTEGDAFGLALLETHAGNDSTYLIERDDGRVDEFDARSYFAPPEDWPELDRRALAMLGGRTLDVGAGAGRFSLEAQAQGQEVVALDVSPGALAVCEARGVSEVFLGTVGALAASSGRFETVLMMGNNLALLGSRHGAGEMFEDMDRLLSSDGVVVGAGRDPYRTDDADHLAYHQRNRDRGRFPGQIHMRERYRDLAGPWYDYLFLSPGELNTLAADNRWAVVELIADGPIYLAVLRPQSRAGRISN